MNYKSLLFILLGTLAIWLGAILSFPIPGSEVPVSMQTLAVILAGALLGPVRGGLAVALYLLAGTLGLPVFAEGRFGIQVLLGPTGGFLFGFLIVGSLSGYHWHKFQAKKGFFAWIIFFMAHVAILLIGFIWLNIYKGEWTFPAQTLVKLFPGLVFKTALGGLILYISRRFVELKK
jgi:biotin transport system substrate-specific component